MKTRLYLPLLLSAGFALTLFGDVFIPADSVSDKSSTDASALELMPDDSLSPESEPGIVAPVDGLEISVQDNRVEPPISGQPEWKDTLPALEMTPASAHAGMKDRGPAETASVARVMSYGLGRGLANVTMAPVELLRGPVFEFSMKKWYVAAATSLPAALGGTLSRMTAGLGDILSLGYFGDVQLAEGYPDFVWQEDWTYHPEAPAASTVLSPDTVPQTRPDTDIRSDDLLESEPLSEDQYTEPPLQ